MSKKFTGLMIVPTGVGAEIGGYAGDAAPAANLLAAVCDRLIVNPNVVNGADFMEAAPNILYVEGAAIDLFMQGKIVFEPVRSNRIGIVIDSAVQGNSALLAPILDAIDATRTNAGIDVMGYTLTERPVGARVLLSSAGVSQGEVDRPEEILKSAQKVIDRGAQAVAIFCLIENPFQKSEDSYRQGKGVDPIGGIEAILSHLIVKELMVPAAHAPIIGEDQRSKIKDQKSESDVSTLKPIQNSKLKTQNSSRPDPRAAAEEIGLTYVPCVLKGLSRSPRIIPAQKSQGGLSVADIDALVLPQGTMGAVPALEALSRKIPIIVVEENKTILEVTPEKLKVEDRVIRAGNYLEAAGILACLKAGIDWKMIRRPVPPLQEI